jgi:L-iditol 2-dehydrogenase
MHARDRACLPENSTVLIFGAGAVGLLCAAVSKAAKARGVIIADIQEDRLRFAVENGFADASIVVPRKSPATIDESLAFAKEVADLVKAVTVNGHSGEVDATYECTGVESCLQSSIYVS